MKIVAKMTTEYATVCRDGYTVPLIGIPSSATQEECSRCKQSFHISEIVLNADGKPCCSKCRAVRERPILFSSSMVLALLNGSKTQTRRVVKSPLCIALSQRSSTFSMEKALEQCPHGKVGDRLWVRETFYDSHLDDKRHPWTYRAGCSVEEDLNRDCKWKPAIFMPRAASRLTLEITEVRVERLQDISNEDAKAEGVVTDCRHEHVTHHVVCAIEAYERLWDSIAKREYAWAKNPWVWVLEVSKLK